jgi:hypothetical protein
MYLSKDGFRQQCVLDNRSKPIGRSSSSILNHDTAFELNPLPVWDLLPNAQTLQAEMTEMIQKNVRHLR